MCGIAGIFSNDIREITFGRLRQMGGAIKHRGPNGEGFWMNKEGNIGFAHRRLSIIDLSENAAQPMHLGDRFTIVYNGEIYNYVELRDVLTKWGHSFKSESDTEVILAAYSHWGKECLGKLDGMFAFAIWDEEEQELFLARDRFGEKPLYYSVYNHAFLFASEMKALWVAGVPKQKNDAAWLFFTATGLAQLPATEEKTFYRKISTLRPGHFLVVKNGEPSKQRQWYQLSKEMDTSITEKDAEEKVALMLSDSVSKRLRGDVEMGNSLSGGIDSSIIVKLVHDVLGPGKFKTFSAIFPGFEKDESQKINILKKEWELQNFTIAPSANELVRSLPQLCYHQEEPIASASVFLQNKIYGLAANNGIKVILDGQGADEVFAGYERYLHWYLQEKISVGKIAGVNKELALLRQNDFNVSWDYKNYLASFAPNKIQKGTTKNAIRLFSHAGFSDEYFHEFSAEAATYVHKPIVKNLNDILHHSITVQGLPELLRYADRNSMSYGAEVRLPFLQHGLVEFVLSLPSHFKIQKGFTKFILRKTYDGELPAPIIWQKGKIGYEPPQQQWMQQPAIMDMIGQARKKLVDEKILSPSTLSKNITTLPAHSHNNFDWRYLITATS